MRVIKHQYHQYLAEFLGTFFLVLIGCGAVILDQISQGESISLLGIPLAFGGIVAVMIYATGHISGAHFNPAVTIAFFITKKFPGKRVFGYMAAQFAGALCASGLHAFIFGDFGHSYGATGISLDMEIEAAIAIEMILSFLLMFVIISVATDSRAVGEMAGTAIGATVFLCALIGGPLTGASMNPARSLGPALMSGNFQLLWLYLVIPIIGAGLGALVYESIRCFREGEDNSHGCC